MKSVNRPSRGDEKGSGECTELADYLIEQLAKIVGISAVVPYFHANRQPADVKTAADHHRVKAAYRAFREAPAIPPI